jgi:hypothetical protein
MISFTAMQEYIDDNGGHCPHCKSLNILAIENVQANDTRHVECHDCGETWIEILGVKGIVEQ